MRTRLPDGARRNCLKGLIGALVLGAASAASAAPPDKIRIGFITTLSGPQSVMGTQMRDSADLALAMLGGKIGGIPAEIIYGDDQQKPDVGRQLAEKMLKKDNVDFVSGLLASNILLAIDGEMIRSKTIMVSANAGPHELAGAGCTPYFFSTAAQNDQSPEAMGAYLSGKGITDIYLMAPNYAAGKDMLAGFKRSFKGRILGETYTTFGQSDYQAELSAVRAAAPKALFVFYPGGMGIQFIKQFAESGLKDKIPLYSVYTVDATNLVQVRDAALGNYDVSFWNADLPVARSREYVDAFRKKYDYTPSNYGADSFDAIFLIDSAVRAVKGDIADKKAVIAAMEKADFPSVRGPFTYNVNHYPIENFYLLKVTKDAGGNPVVAIDQKIATDEKDPYYADCHMKQP